MTSSSHLPQSRGGRWSLCIVLTAVLVVAGTLLVRWHGSVGHQADEYADSFRDMPGVTSVQVEGSGDNARDLAIHMASSASRVQLQDVHDRRRLPEDIIDDVTVVLGATEAATDSYSEDEVVDMQWALRGVRHGEIDVGARRVSATADKYPALTVARQIVSILKVRSMPGLDVDVRGNGGVVTIGDKVDLPAADTALGALAPYASSISGSTIYTSGLSVNLAVGHSGDMTKVATAAQRAVRGMRSFGLSDAENVEFTVRAPAGEGSISGDPDTDLGGARDVRRALTQKGWTVGLISTDLSAVSVATETAAARDLPRLRRDLASLHSALPKDAIITLTNNQDRRLDVFSGTVAELERVTPRLMALEGDGYQLSWAATPRGTDISVLLPEGTELNEDSVRMTARKLRAVGWTDSAAIVIQQREREDEGYFPPYVALTSTATGRATASSVKVLPTTAASVLPEDARRAWDETANK